MLIVVFKLNSLDEFIKQDVCLGVLKYGVNVSRLNPLIVKALPSIVAIHCIRYIMTTVSEVALVFNNRE